MLIINGVVHTMEDGTIPSGYVRTEGSRIAAVGPMSSVPEAGPEGVVDAQGGHVLPGFIDAHCHLGLYGCGAGEDDLNEEADAWTPQLRAVDGVNPMNRYFAEARRAGVTAVLTGPGSANPIAGQSVLMKTAGTVVDRMVVRAPASMKFALGENPKRTHAKDGPATRMASAALIREKLTQALDYELRRTRAQADGTMEGPEYDAKLEAKNRKLADEVEKIAGRPEYDALKREALEIQRRCGQDGLRRCTQLLCVGRKGAATD